MKFCKDCKRYSPSVSADGGSLLPGFFMYIPATCNSENIASRIDLVSGEKRGGGADCATVRADEEMCGESGAWFVPATLDGRLAMLESK